MIMRNMTNHSVNRVAALFLSVCAMLFIVACDRTPEKRGWDYFPDMHYSPAYGTYSENPNFPDQKTMQKPVEGTVPVDMIPFQYEKTEEDLERAGRELNNPFSYDPENLARGEKAFMAFCSQCHGEKGDGQGVLYTSGKYLVPPTSLIEEKVRLKPDGGIYHTISAGYGVMGEHASIIRPDDRWKIILYIREVLQKAPQKD
jgi:mono/diheme cytochrome c family protein